MSLRSIVEKLGGDLYEGGRRANIPAPGHSAHDRSVSLLLSEGRVVVHAFNGVDWRDVLDDLRRRSLIDARNAPGSIAGATTSHARAAAGDAERKAVARRIWDGGRAVHGRLSERHIRLRGVRRKLPGAEVLRHHFDAPISVYRGGGRGKPALLAGITDADGAFSAAEVTYLDPNGHRAVGLRLPRKTVGSVPAGSAIRIDLAEHELLVGEGLITTLSASERFQLPGWALMSTRNMRRWSPPPGVRFVLIAADRGEDGEASAQFLAGRLRRAGVGSRIELPPLPHGDWNDVARAAQAFA